jgi:hypothetical protein
MIIRETYFAPIYITELVCLFSLMRRLRASETKWGNYTAESKNLVNSHIDSQEIKDCDSNGIADAGRCRSSVKPSH